MKFALVALVGIASAQSTPKDVGTACTKSSECGDTDKMCCGVAAGGKMCATDACTDMSSKATVPNIMICNNRETHADFIVKQANYDGKKTVYAKYAAGDFNCMSGAKALVATGAALLAAASMI